LRLDYLDSSESLVDLARVPGSRPEALAGTAPGSANLGTGALVWLDLQAKYNLEKAEQELAARIETEARPRQPA